MREYIRIIIGVFLLCGGCGLISDHYNDDLRLAEKEKIDHYDKLVKEPAKTTAVLDSVYEEVTVKILGVPMKSYNFNYFFSVDGRKYQGKCSFDNIPNVPLITISYLAEDPEINSNNPEKELESLKENQESNFFLYVGYAFVILGLFRTFASIFEIRAQKKAREAEEQRQLEEDNQRIFGNG